MFENPLLERLSHVHPVTPLVLYAPIILACLFVSALYFDLSLGRIAVAVVLGYFGWTLLEYWLCLLYTSPSPRDATLSRMPSSA